MKKTLTLLFIALYLNASATTYYISSSGNDSANGLSESTPWKTISKLNSSFYIIKPGDRILFKRGDTFHGTIKITKSGTSASPIYFGAYGTGDKPIITGFTTISSWTNVGSGIYSASLTCESSPEMVTIDGIQYAMGRWPNSKVWPEPQTWASIDSYVGVTSLTDAELAETGINWAGAELVVRNSNRNRISRYPVTNHTGNTLAFSGGSTSYPLAKDWGYFVQNDKRTLDEFGEWYYDTKTSTFYMYFGSENPASYSVEVTTINALIRLERGITNIQIENLSLKGSNNTAVYGLGYNHNSKIENCNISLCGHNGIYTFESKDLKINGCTIDNCNDNAISLKDNCENTYIGNNEIKNTGLFPGIGKGLWESAKAIYLRGTDDAIIEYNKIRNSGYSAIHFSGNNVIVRNNFIDTFSFIKEDCGGIQYSSGSAFSNMQVMNNIVLNGLGSPGGMPNGTTHWVVGIELDYYTTGGFEISNNTVANIKHTAGILISGSQNVVVMNNTVFECTSGVRMQELGGTATPTPPRNITMTGNIIFAKTVTNIPLSLYSTKNDLDQFGSFDNNYYARPLNNAKPIRTGIGGVVTSLSLTDWQTLSGMDLNSRISPIALTDTADIDFYYNATSSNKLFTLSKPMIDIKGTKYLSSITLAPFTSVVLMADPDPISAPEYISSSFPTYPTLMVMKYSETLANIVPPASAFSVIANSVPKIVKTVMISGNTVRLYLEEGIAPGDIVTVSYSKPATNPLQSEMGIPAASISNKPVDNYITGSGPEYISSSIPTYPSLMVMKYSENLANIVPALSAFTVLVNSVPRTIKSVIIDGAMVRLYLETGVKYGDIVTISYTKPETNPLQSALGITAASISNKPVVNCITGSPPEYISSSIPTYPNLMVMNYNITLADIVPPASAFTVMANSVQKPVKTVMISGKTVRLYLEEGVNPGDIVTVSYTIPGTNPLQSAEGGLAESIINQMVTNKITGSPPVYISSTIPTYPTIMVMNYDDTLADIVPPASAFTVMANSVQKHVKTVMIKGNTVRLYLIEGVAPGDFVTVSYSKPVINPLQSLSGGLAVSISNQPVTNNISDSKSGNTGTIADAYFDPVALSGFVYEIDASVISDKGDGLLSFDWIAPPGVNISSTSGPKIRYLSPVVTGQEIIEFTLSISDGFTKHIKNIPISIMPYKPEIEKGRILEVLASNYNLSDYPDNVTDNSIATKWSAAGTDQWLWLKLADPMKISHLNIAFLTDQKYESYFDIYASNDNLMWEPVLMKASSCNFSGANQVFDFPANRSDNEYSFLKLVCNGNALDNWNYISEINVFGSINKNATGTSVVSVYPNPAREFINITFKKEITGSQILNIYDSAGKICFTCRLDSGISNIQIPISFDSGVYYVRVVSGKLILFSQKLVVIN
ncbi:MAG: T9SS type A sorting domain-containing protein [Bacteroidetes bacterium]|nr:T9SS type A sorting domain-containing protein [Bacteroidota bacterium]